MRKLAYVFAASLATRYGLTWLGCRLARRVGVLLEVCAWCRSTTGLVDPEGMRGGVSHGICKPCLSKLAPVVEALRETA